MPAATTSAPPCALALPLAADEARILELTLRRWGRRSIVLTLEREGRLRVTAKSAAPYTSADVKAAQGRIQRRAQSLARAAA